MARNQGSPAGRQEKDRGTNVLTGPSSYEIAGDCSFSATFPAILISKRIERRIASWDYGL